MGFKYLFASLLSVLWGVYPEEALLGPMVRFKSLCWRPAARPKGCCFLGPDKGVLGRGEGGRRGGVEDQVWPQGRPGLSPPLAFSRERKRQRQRC